MPSEVLRTGQEESDPDQSVDHSPSWAAGEVARQPAELPLDVTFELLQNQRRRRLLRHMEEASGTVDIGTLAEELAAQENDKPVRALTSSERKRVYICLYQCHLPKLDDAGVVEFDSDRGTVERTDLTAHLTDYLDRVTGTSAGGEATRDPWPARYVGISLVGGGLYALQATMVPSALVSYVIVGVMVGLLLVASLVHAATP